MEGEATLHDGTIIPIWGFISWDSLNVNKLPSPTLYFSQGDSVHLLVDNVSEMAHTIHLHGLDVNQENDGVPSTSFQIPGYGVGEYHFKVDQPGTFLYHCHVETVIHLQMGMFGAVVVRPKEDANTLYDSASPFDKEYLWLASEIDASWHDPVPLNGAVPAYEPDYFLVNGKSKTQIDNDSSIAIAALPNEKIALRIANMGYGIHTYNFPGSIHVSVIGSDGRKFAIPENTNTLTVYPGERYALLLNSSTEVSDNISLTYYGNYKHELWGENTIPIVIAEAPVLSIGEALNTAANLPYTLIKEGNEYLLLSENLVKVRIIDVNGKIIEQFIDANHELRISLPAPGIYFAHILLGDNTYVEKLFY